MKIMIKVIPNSKIEAVIKDSDKLQVRVKEPPKEGKANKAIIKLLAKHFHVPQSSISIVSGLGSKNKLIEILGK